MHAYLIILNAILALDLSDSAGWKMTRGDFFRKRTHISHNVSRKSEAAEKTNPARRPPLRQSGRDQGS